MSETSDSLEAVRDGLSEADFEDVRSVIRASLDISSEELQSLIDTLNQLDRQKITLTQCYIKCDFDKARFILDRYNSIGHEHDRLMADVKIMILIRDGREEMEGVLQRWVRS
jgi:hypothetical protein